MISNKEVLFGMLIKATLLSKLSERPKSQEEYENEFDKMKVADIRGQAYGIIDKLYLNYLAMFKNTNQYVTLDEFRAECFLVDGYKYYLDYVENGIQEANK